MRRKIAAVLAASMVATAMGITALAGSDSCSLTGGGYVGTGSLRSMGGDSYNGQTSSNGCDNRVIVHVIDHFGDVVTNTDSGIVGKTASVNSSYIDGSIGANSNHTLHLHGTQIAYGRCSVGK